MDKFMTILIYDGDDAGKLCGQKMIANDMDGFAEISEKINLGNELVRQWTEQHGGQVLASGGDGGAIQIPEEALEDIESLRKDYQFVTGLTLSVGSGKDLAEAGNALCSAKQQGKNRFVRYSAESAQDGSAKPKGEVDHIDQYLEDKAAQSRQGYLEDKGAESRQKYIDDKGDESRAAYLESKAAPEADESSEVANLDAVAPDQAPEKAPTDAPTPPGVTPLKPGQELNPPAMPVPSETSEQGQPPAPAGQDSAPAAPSGQDGAPIPTDKEGMQAIVSQIEAEGGAPQESEKGPMDHIDAEDLAIGHAMEDGTSRPENFDEKNAPGDMGLSQKGDEEAPAEQAEAAIEADNKEQSGQVPTEEQGPEAGSEESEEESPDLTDVLQGGLDQHADEIKREKVIQMVSEALAGFKANKAIVERAKDQAPEFYHSAIAMLRAMIEMAKMMGLGTKQPDSEPQEQDVAPAEPTESPQGDAAAQDPKAGLR